MSRRQKRGRMPGSETAPHTTNHGCACSVAEGDTADNGPSPFRLLMNMGEIAEASHVSLSVVRRWVSAGYLTPVELPLLTRRKLFHRDDVLRFIANPEAGHEQQAV